MQQTTARPRYLTKSRFSIALECPTKLAYLDDDAFANADAQNEFLRALADGGHQVGALAKTLFPDGIEVDANTHDAQVEQTRALLQRDDVTLFEAAIRVGRLFIRADLLRKSGNVIELYEVKAKGYDPAEPGFVGKRGDFSAGMKPYLYDVGFQRHVLRLAFPGHTVRAHLVMPNKRAVCSEAGLGTRLRIVRSGDRVRIDIDPALADGVLAWQILAVVPVDDYLDALEVLPLDLGPWQTAFAEGIAALAERLDGDAWAPRPGSHCRTCQFRATAEQRAGGLRDGRAACWRAVFGLDDMQFSAGTVLDLYSTRSVGRLLAAGKRLLVDLEPEDVKLAEDAAGISVSHRQWLQSEEARGAAVRPMLRQPQVRTALAALTFPLHFVDFETSRPALPFHAGRRPYEQLLFQFSHHRLDIDEALRHQSEYLAMDAALPNFATLRALHSALADDAGSVLHWWVHERTVLGELREQLVASAPGEITDRDELIAFIAKLLGTKEAPGRLVDLGRLVHRTTWFPGTASSSSLKKVLSALFAGSARLRDRWSQPIYGGDGGIRSLNFVDQAWITFAADGHVVDPYKLLGARSDDHDLRKLEQMEAEETAIADGGAAMVAWGLLQSGLLDEAARQRIRSHLLRYCELDTLAMVMAYEGLLELLGDPGTQ